MTVKSATIIPGKIEDLDCFMADLGRAARRAATLLAATESDAKNTALGRMADAIRSQSDKIIQANKLDISTAKEKGISDAFLDRLKLNADRIKAMANGIEAIAALPDPVGETMASWERPNGLRISRVRVPLGVIGIIYESRPNVTADAGALCLKAGNAAILRGGSESRHSSRAIHACLVDGLMQAGLTQAAIQLIPTTDRAAVGIMLGGIKGAIDVIIPRGGKSLVERVQREARVPVLSHLEGNCHIYVDGCADLKMARAIVINAKMRRTGICGAAETLLIDRAIAENALAPIVSDLIEAGCEVRGDKSACAIDSRIQPATESDWSTEYLGPILAVKIVDGVDAAINHIAVYGSHHTESIVTDNADNAERFLARADSAIVLHNASTQFADGGEFGMGAEIGISTGKLHSPGPVGAEQLTTFKYIVRGSGQIRP